MASRDPEYPSRRGEPSPWEARWSLPRTRPFSSRAHPLARGVLALVAAIAIIVVADLVLSGTAFALVAVAVMLIAFALLRF
jgi:hypothetical protein